MLPIVSRRHRSCRSKADVVLLGCSWLDFEYDRIGMESRASPPTRDRWRSTSARRLRGTSQQEEKIGVNGLCTDGFKKAARGLVLLGNARARGLNVRSNSRGNCRNDCCSLSAGEPRLSCTPRGAFRIRRRAIWSEPRLGGGLRLQLISGTVSRQFGHHLYVFGLGPSSGGAGSHIS